MKSVGRFRIFLRPLGLPDQSSAASRVPLEIRHRMSFFSEFKKYISINGGLYFRFLSEILHRTSLDFDFKTVPKTYPSFSSSRYTLFSFVSGSIQSRRQRNSIGFSHKKEKNNNNNSFDSVFLDARARFVRRNTIGLWNRKCHRKRLLRIHPQPPDLVSA